LEEEKRMRRGFGRERRGDRKEDLEERVIRERTCLEGEE